MQINENAKLKQENQQLQESEKRLEEEVGRLERQVGELKEQLSNCTRNYYAVEKEASEQKRVIETLADQKVFLQQVGAGRGEVCRT